MMARAMNFVMVVSPLTLMPPTLPRLRPRGCVPHHTTHVFAKAAGATAAGNQDDD
jgi:hypothetical protein